MKKALYIFVSFSLTLYLLTATLMLAKDSNPESKSGTSAVLTGESSKHGTLWGQGTYDYANADENNYNYRIRQIAPYNNWKIVSCQHTLIVGIQTDGTMWSIEVMVGHPIYYYSPKQIGTDKDWKFVSVNGSNLLAIKTDGSLWALGSNYYGALGDSTIPKNEPQWHDPIRVDSANMKDIVFANTGDNYSSVVKKDGTIWNWGLRSGMSDGYEQFIDYRYPVQIGNSNDWKFIAGDGGSISAIKQDGTLWGWGQNNHGELGDGTNEDKKTPVQIGTDNNWESVVIENTKVLALKKDGTLWGWGDTLIGISGDPSTECVNHPIQIGTDNDWIIIDIGYSQALGIKKDGSVWTWGGGFWNFENQKYAYYNTPTKIDNRNDVVYADAGYGFNVLIRRHPPTIPEVITLPITNINSKSAQSGGKVVSEDTEVIVRGICYNTSSNPTLYDNKTVNGPGEGEFQSVMTGLVPYTKYYVRAYATNSVGTAYGQEETFKTKLGIPLLISPKNNTLSALPSGTLVWENLPEAQKYCVQLSENDKFISNNLNEFTNLTSINYKNLKRNTLYNWRVKAINGLDSSEWSEIWSFTTTKFNPPELISPVNDTINIPIDCKLTWKQNTSTSKYLLQVSKNKDFKDLIIDSVTSVIYLNCDGLDFFGSYFWRVKAVEDADSSKWSSTWHFVTLMDSINLISPADSVNSVDCKPEMNWEKGIYGKNYRLQISKLNDFKNKHTDILISTNNFNNIKNLDYWQKYFWRVRNESGDTLGYWSQIWQFKTGMSDILLVYPEDTQTGLDMKINFKWFEAIGGKYYQLQISKNELFTDLVYSRDSIQKTSQFVPDLEPDILYYWRVRVWNTESIGTAYWSEVWTFRTGTSGIKDESEFIKIIPNPAGDFITIKLGAINPAINPVIDTATDIRIYNTLSEKVMSVEAGRDLSVRINISDLPKGMYFVKAGGETAKFVKI